MILEAATNCILGAENDVSLLNRGAHYLKGKKGMRQHASIILRMSGSAFNDDKLALA